MKNQSLDQIESLSRGEKEKYLYRMRTAFHIRIDAELGDGTLSGIHDHANETIIIESNGYKYYFLGLTDQGILAIREDRIERKDPEIIDGWIYNRQVFAYQQLLANPWIVAPENLNILELINISEQ